MITLQIRYTKLQNLMVLNCKVSLLRKFYAADGILTAELSLFKNRKIMKNGALGE